MSLIDKLNEERNDLSTKIGHLKKALNQVDKFGISEKQQVLLEIQCDVMKTYANVLAIRIKNLQEAMPSSRITSGTIDADKVVGKTFRDIAFTE